MNKDIIVSKTLTRFEEAKSQITETDFVDKLKQIDELIIKSIVETLVDEINIFLKTSD